MPSITEIDVTRPSRDGGRDAIGKFRIGREHCRVDVEFALEAKCYAVSNSVGIKETARLISRLRHRQFGLLVTTSFVNQQAYRELIEDDHPVVVVSGGDIVEILRRAGISNAGGLESWCRSFTNSAPRLLGTTI
jgi:hypothetical protein